MARKPAPTYQESYEEVDAYQEYLKREEAAKLEQLAAGRSADETPQEAGFQLVQPEIGQSSNVGKPGVSSTISNDLVPKLDIGGDSLSGAIHGYQLEEPAIIQGMGSMDGMDASTGSMVGAGIGAAGQAAGVLAKLAGAKAAQDSILAGNALNRESSERLARMSLMQNQKQFDQSNQMNAYQQMAAALNQASEQTMQQRRLNRANTRSRADGLTTAFLGA